MKNLELQQKTIQEINIHNVEYEEVTSNIINILTNLEEIMLNKKITMKEDKKSLTRQKN